MAICFFFLWHAVNTIADGGPERDIAVVTAGLMIGWLWIPPIYVIITSKLKSDGSRPTTSRWRLFWQAQGLIYAVSLLFLPFCLVSWVV